MAAPAGFTESEWRELGSHTCPRTSSGCKCRVHYGIDAEPYFTSLRLVKPPPETKINRQPAKQPWIVRPARQRAA